MAKKKFVVTVSLTVNEVGGTVSKTEVKRVLRNTSFDFPTGEVTKFAVRSVDEE